MILSWLGGSSGPGWSLFGSVLCEVRWCFGLHLHLDGLGRPPAMSGGWQAAGIAAFSCLWSLILQEVSLSLFTWWSQGSECSKGEKVPVYAFKIPALINTSYHPIGQHSLTQSAYNMELLKRGESLQPLLQNVCHMT